MDIDMEDVREYANKTLAYLIETDVPVPYEEVDENVFGVNDQFANKTKMWMLETGLVDNETPVKDPDADPTKCVRYLVPTEEGRIWHGAFDFPHIIALYNEDETQWEYGCDITDKSCIHNGKLHCDKCEVAKNN